MLLCRHDFRQRKLKTGLHVVTAVGTKSDGKKLRHQHQKMTAYRNVKSVIALRAGAHTVKTLSIETSPAKHVRKLFNEGTSSYRGTDPFRCFPPQGRHTMSMGGTFGGATRETHASETMRKAVHHDYPGPGAHSLGMSHHFCACACTHTASV